MAKYTQSELASKLGKTRGWLNVYTKRGGVTNPIVKDGVIDDSIPQNRLFIDKWLAMRGDVPKVKAEPNQVKEEETVSLAEQKLKAEIAYKLGQVEKLKLEQAKLRGSSIPIDAVGALITSLGNGFQQSYKSGADSLMMELSNKYKIPAKGVAELKGFLYSLINDSHDRGVKLSKKDLRNIISDVKFKDEESI